MLLKRLYTNQEAAVRKEFEETYNIDIGKRVPQGCILSPLLLNIYAENIMREALGEWESGISIGGRMVTNLRYADDTTLLAGTKEDLIELVEKVRRASEKAGLYLNVGETNVVTTGDIGEVTVYGKDIEVVKKFVFLGALHDYQGRTMREGSAKKNSCGKSRNGGTNINMEGQGSNATDEGETSESFGVRDCSLRSGDLDNEKTREKEDRRFRVVVLENILRVPWMERKTNIWIIENIKPEWTLESRVPKAALSYFGHVVRAGGVEDDVMLGRLNGTRRRGRPRQIWLDTTKGYSSGATISNMRRDARDRAGWRGAAMAVARGRIRLDGTRQQH